MNKNKVKIFREFVENLTTLSKCTDRQVACLICDKDFQQIYSIGVNGGPKGSEDMECLCATDTKYSCIHAEANALIKLQANVPDKVMICSLAPCTQCASMIINEPGGFSMVLFLELWKEALAIQMLKDAGITVGQIKPDGTILLSTSCFGLVSDR